MKKIITLLTLITVIATTSQAQIGNYSVGQTAPDFSVVDHHGVTQTLYQYTNAGKYVVLDFFAYWCGPCKSTAPIIDQFYKKYGCNAYDVAVLGLELEGTEAQMAQFDSECTPPLVNAYPAASGKAPGNAAAVHAAWGSQSFPTVAIVGPDKKFMNVYGVWPISNVSDIESEFPNGALTPHSCATGIIESISAADISLFPSPATSVITISMNNAIAGTVKISNVLGKTVMNQEVSSLDLHELNISKLESGIYFMEINTEKGVVTKKFIKK